MLRATVVAVIVVVAAVITSTTRADPPEKAVVQVSSTQETGRGIAEWGRTLMDWMRFEDYNNNNNNNNIEHDNDYHNKKNNHRRGSPDNNKSQDRSSLITGKPPPLLPPPPPQGRMSHYYHNNYWPPAGNPYPHQHQQQQQHQHSNQNNIDRVDVYKKLSKIEELLIEIARVAIPVGLLLTAVPASLATVFVRRRSIDNGPQLLHLNSLGPSELPLLHEITETRDFSLLLEPRCREKLFCELARLGGHDHASFMQSAFYYSAMLTPDLISRRMGLTSVFKAAREGHCDALSCPSHPNHHSASASPPEFLSSNHLTNESFITTSQDAVKT